MKDDSKVTQEFLHALELGFMNHQYKPYRQKYLFGILSHAVEWIQHRTKYTQILQIETNCDEFRQNGHNNHNFQRKIPKPYNEQERETR